MKISDDALLSKISKNNVYLDKKSTESFTNKTKPKYKLAGHKLLENYFFHILTTNKSACKRNVTITIKTSEWEDKIAGSYLPGACSYCDLTKHEVLERKTILEKIKDPLNGFPYIAKLCSSKCAELQDVFYRKMMHRPDISKEVKGIVANGLVENTADLLKKLGLS